MSRDSRLSNGTKLSLWAFRFPKGKKIPEEYTGAREEIGFYEFIQQKTGPILSLIAGVKIVSKKAPSAVKVLTSGSFNPTVLESAKFTLVEFYAPWCL